MSPYPVTGGAGFIGSHLSEAVVAQGDRVRILDDFSTGRRENLEGLRAHPAAEVMESDLRDLEVVRRTCQGVDHVLHQGALPSVPRSVADPATTHSVNASGTLHMLIAAREAGVKRVVYASSSSVYGNTPSLPKREPMRPDPLSPYAVSKLAGEHYCAAFWNTWGLETVCLRYFNVFGPRQRRDSLYAAVIPVFISALQDDRSLVIQGDGLQSRDFTFVANVVEANLLAAKAPMVAGKVLNIACGESHTLLELLALLARTAGRTVPTTQAKPRAGDVRHSLADISRAGRLLRYRPRVSFGEGISRTAEWFGLGGPGRQLMQRPHASPASVVTAR